MDFSIYNNELKDVKSFLDRYGTEKAIFEIILELSNVTKEIRSHLFMSKTDIMHLDLFLAVYTEALKKLDEKFDIDTSFERRNLRKAVEGSFQKSSEPSGRKTFKVWFNEMCDQYKQDLFEKMICSACPYCNEHREKSETFPCTLIPATSAMPTYPWRCHLLDEDDACFDRGDLLRKIKKEKGEKALNIFLEREKKLKGEYAKTIMEKNKDLIQNGGVMRIKTFRNEMRYLVENGHDEELRELIGLVENENPNLIVHIIDILPEDR